MKELWIVTGSIDDVAALGLIREGTELAVQKSLKPVVLYTEDERSDNEIHIRNELIRMYAEREPEAILFECSQFFGAVAPAFAVKINRGITADCTQLEWDDNHGLLQIRPTYGGRKMAVNISINKPYVATVREGIFPKEDFKLDTGKVETIKLAENNSTSGILFEYISSLPPGKSLSTADIIFSGGMGLGSKDNYRKMEYLASLAGAKCGASRAAVAAGYAPYSNQVGQTGKTVRPRLYVAFGISGAVQHLSGIINAEKIVAVNTDTKAPIHDYADYFIEADANEVIGKMISILETEILTTANK